MSKKILFMSSAKLKAISFGLLLAVFCTIGMSFRPVYDENEAEEIVMSGPRRSHWTTTGTEGSGCSSTTVTYYNDRKDYAKTIAQSLNSAYGTVAITANSKNATPVTAADGSQSYVEWDSGVTEHEPSAKNKTENTGLDDAHTNTITFTATPTDPDEYRFVGWYSDAGGTSLVSAEGEATWEKEVKFATAVGITSYNSGSAVTTYESTSSRWTVTYYAKFEKIPSTNVTFLAASTPARDNGYYTVAGKGISETTITTSNQTIGVKGITLTAYASEMAEFVRWYTEDGAGNRTTISEENPCVTSFTEASTVGVEWRELKNNLNITFKAVEKDANGNRKGSYTVDGVTVSATDYVHFTGSTYKYRPTLVATPATGYGFKGWYVKEAGAKKYLSTEATWNATITDEVTIYADFVYVDYPAESLAQFKVGSTYYDDLNAANTAAHGGSNKVIICSRDGYLLPGSYTISSDVTLLIPYSSSSTSKQTTPALIEIPSPAPLPNAYRTLTMLDGADITCNGTICVGGQMISHQGGNPTGCPGGDLGIINMANGGHIELTSGATLYCWGMIKGQDRDKGNNTDGVGTITANNGATVWENIAFGDWRGGSQTFAAYECRSTYRSFPFQSYSIQNIEVPLSLKYGSSEKVYTALYIPTGGTGSVPTSPTLIANTGALFLLKDNKSLVRKWYDPTTDLVCYEMSGTAQLNELSITVSISIASRTINSADFDLPICSNMHIILTKCDMTLSKPMTMHAGSVLEIKPDATVTIASNLHIFDLDQFDMFAYSKYYMTVNNLTSHKYRGTGTTKEYIDDAKLIVDGTLKVTGGIYTTANGANIMGNGGGKVIFQSALPGEKNIWFLKGGASGTKDGGTLYHFDGILGQGKADIYLTPYAVNAANLCNEDGTYTKSAKNTFYNVNGRWFVEGKQNERTSAGFEHTYDFTYMASGNSGTDVNTPAVYSHDRTGLEPRMKWFNVSADGCANWWVDGSSRLYNWTKFSDWHQFIPTEITDVYGCSNGELYTKVSCTQWDPLGGTDENCLYTIGGVKKALVGTSFIDMEPNADDAAYHRKGAATEYYISFDGCIWHSATRIEDEKKAYTIEGQQFIWFENNWLNVTREVPFFYSLDELNVKTYYEYIGSEWVIAEPYVRVTTSDPTQTRSFLTFHEAVAVASQYKNPTITILRDLKGFATPFSYTAANTTCTLNLNGHKAELTVRESGTTAIKMFTINASGSTFTITDTSEGEKGELKLIASVNTATSTQRWSGIYLQNGSLILQKGKISIDHPFTWVSNSNTGLIQGILVASGKSFTMNGGKVYVEADYNPYGICGASGTPTITVNGGTIETVARTKDSPYSIIGYGTINVTGTGEVRAIALKSSSSRGVSVSASSSYQGTLNVTGGTIYSEATSSAQGVNCGGTVVVTGDYNATTPDNTPKSRHYAKANISGGTITAVCSTSTTSYGVLSYGTTTISGGTITSTVQKSNQSDARGVCVNGGTTTIQNGANITANAPTKAYGVYCSGANGDTNRGWPHVGVVNITGGTITANTTNTTIAYGLYVTGATWTINRTNSYKVFNGDYASAGTATVTGGYFYANAKTSTAMGIGVANTVTKNEASATPVCTINGGYFKMTGTGSLTGANTAALPANFHVNGGYYSHDGNLEGYAVSPKHVVTLPSSDPNRPNYNYKVAEAYTITFKSENGETTLQSSYQEKGTTPVYEGAPQTKGSSTTTSYVFDGWSSSIGGSLVSPLPSVTSSGGTYYAHFNETTLKYMVTLDAKTNGGNEEAQVIYVEPSAAVGTLPTATKTGYTQTGWYTAASGGTKLETTTSITADGTYYAQFGINSHTLTWNLAGGTVKTAGTGAAASATGSPSSSVNYNATITAPVVTKTGYTFANWGVPTVVAKMPDNDLAYTAVWTPATNTKYYVKHYQQNINDDGYTLADTETKTGTTDATVTPDRKSYDGFLTPDPQSLTIGAAGTSSLTYNYDRVVYTIKWNAYANGGTCSAPNTNIRHGKTLGTMPEATPNSAGLVFGGWYTAADGGMRITETTPILQNYGTLYAHFVPTYTVTWKNYDESELATIELPYDAIPSYGSNPTPTRATDENYGYTFDGWSATNGGDKVEEPLPAIFENKTYYAHYSTTPTVASVKVGNTTTYYTDFATAWAFVQEQTANTTIKLLQDATAEASLVFTPAAAMTCTLDLNNHTLSGEFGRLIDINLAGSTFIITDNSVAKGGKVSNNYSENARVYGVVLTAGTLKLQGGTISSTNPHTYSTAAANKSSAATAVYVAAGQTFTMENGTLESSSQYASYAIYMARGTSTVTINNGLVKGETTASTTAAGIYNLGKGLTVNGGRIVGHAYTTTAYGIYLNGGHGTINGGTIEATNDTTSSKGTTTTYGIYVNYYNSTYKGVLTIPSTSTVNVLAKARTTTSYAIVVGGSSTGSTIAGGTFTAKTKTGKTAYAVNSSGNITISGGTFIANSATTNAYGLYSARGTITVSGNPTFNVTSGTSTAYGALAYGTIGKKGTGKYSGTIKINGGTFNVTSTSTDAYGALAGLASRDLRSCSATNDTVPGLHYMPGILEITNGTFNVKAKTTTAYGVHVAKAKSESGTVGTTARIPLGTVTGGKFKVESMGDANATAYAMNSATTAARLVVQGGYYNTKRTDASETSNIEDKYTAPTKACNYHVLDLADEDPYKYEVAEAYTITFNNYDGDELQSGVQRKGSTPIYAAATPEKPQDDRYTYAFNEWSPALATVTAAVTYTATFTATPRTFDITLNTNGGTINAGNVTSYTYGTGATLPTNVTKSGSEFGGWYDNEELTGDAVTEIGTTAFGNKEFWAKWNVTEYGHWLDIVDVDNENQKLLINVSGWPASGWPYYINGTEYIRDVARLADRTMWLPYTGEPGEDFTITVRQLTADGALLSKHTYEIPKEVMSNSTLSVAESNPLYVKGTTMNVSLNMTASNIYVAPDAKLHVVSEKTLTVDTIFLRTTPTSAAELILDGDLNEDAQVVYTRIISSKSGYFQFGLPLSCDINLEDIRLSDGTDPKYYTGSGWVLRTYDEESRAINGLGDNWVSLGKTEKIEGGKGYEMYSGVNYYREFYFPVNVNDLSAELPVAYTAGPNPVNNGWNMLVSPLTSTFVKEPMPEDLVVSWMEADGFTPQTVPSSISPAKVFAYQAAEAGTISFDVNTYAPIRNRIAAADEQTRIQWIHLDLTDANGAGDQTSIYAHPTRYEQYYQTGIDVAKQSLTASRAIIYSSHAYGDMAFAGVSDSLLEQGVALTVYNPSEQELTFSMRENRWLNRMALVWLVDTETGAQIDLLDSNYSVLVPAGTTRGRFYISGIFKAPQITTENGNVQSDDEDIKAKKFIYNDKMYIQINGVIYDATGKLVK